MLPELFYPMSKPHTTPDTVLHYSCSYEGSEYDEHSGPPGLFSCLCSLVHLHDPLTDHNYIRLIFFVAGAPRQRLRKLSAEPLGCGKEEKSESSILQGDNREA